MVFTNQSKFVWRCRKIKRATNIHDLVQALDKVNEASKKELAGALYLIFAMYYRN